MENPLLFVKEFIQDKSVDWLDKAILACIHLCAFSIILSIVLAQLFAALIILLGVIDFIRNPNRTKTPFDIPLLLFIFVRILSIIFSTDVAASIRILHTEIPFYAIFYAVSQKRNIIQGKYIQSILYMFIAAAIIGTFYGAISFLLGSIGRAASLTSGYYTFGTYLTASFAITLLLGKSNIFEKKRVLWYILTGIMTVGILLTMNRIHWGIMAAVVIITGILQERRLFAGMIIIFLILLISFPTVRHRLDQTIHFTEHLSDRDVIWKGASMIWLNHPVLGYGPNTFAEVFPIKNEFNDSKIGGWHNDYLQVFIESGILGLITMMWLIITLFVKTYIFLKNNTGEKHLRKLTIALIASITTILVSSLTGSAFSDLLIRMMFVLMMALLIVPLQYKKSIN